MTPEALTGLALLLLEFQHWLEEEDPSSLDVAMVSATVDVIGRARQQLTRDGAR